MSNVKFCSSLAVKEYTLILYVSPIVKPDATLSFASLQYIWDKSLQSSPW